MRSLFILLIIVSLCHCIANKVHAETLESNNYRLRMGNFNVTSGFKSSSTYSLTDTVGQTVANYFSSTGYHTRAGFQYLYALTDFSFSLSSTAINLSLTPNTFSTDSHTITVTAPGQGYSVTVIALTPLTQTGTSTTIPSTTCDDGNCTKSLASIWSNPVINGFGYNLTGNDIASDFVGSSYFRPFPDLSSGDNPETIMTSIQSGKNRLATVNYQLSPSGSQAAGTYTTSIVYIATPAY